MIAHRGFGSQGLMFLEAGGALQHPGCFEGGLVSAIGLGT